MIMETKINIAEILRDKPENTKLYSPLFGDVYLSYIQDSIIKVTHHGGITKFFNNGRYYNYPESEQLLFPSKKMRDWSKFAWKKGDILISKDNDVYVIFEKFEDDAYTRFKGKHYLWKKLDEEDYSKEESQMLTSLFEKVNDHEAQTYINTIEERLGGKLNRETLEIEKAQPEFKDGDIVTITFNWGEDIVYIFKSEDSNSYSYYAWLNGSIPTIIESSHPKSDIYTVRLSTEQEKQQLFDALAKEGKAWDADKKMIVDLKLKIELKPFDKVLVRNNEYQNWRVNLFGFIDDNGYYNCAYSKWAQCIPYKGNESLLGTTKDVED